jgi:hypothetical protein
MTPPATEGYTDFEGHQTWYRVAGGLPALAAVGDFLRRHD